MTAYYIDSVNGNDAALGTSSNAAWRTFANLNAMAANTLTGGDEIVLVDGSTWTGEYINFSPYATAIAPLLLSEGGNEQNTSKTIPVTIRRSGGGAMPVIDCNSAVTVGITLDGGAWAIDGIEIKNSLAYGIYLTQDIFASDPPAYSVRNCVVHDCLYDLISLGSAATGTAASRVRTVLFNTAYNGNNDGIALQGNSSGVLVFGNLIHDVGIASPFDFTSGDGITSHASAYGLIIRGNVIYNCVDGINCINDGTTSRNVIERNWVYDCNETCIWITTDTTTADKWDIWNNVLGMKAGMNVSGDIDNGEGTAIKIGWPDTDFDGQPGTPTTNSVHDVRIWHNTIYNATAALPGVLLVAKGASASDSVWSVLGNVIDTTSTGRYFKWSKGGGTPAVTCDRNVFDTERANGWMLDGTGYATIAAWRTAASVDANSVVGDPALVGNPTTAIDNARLQSGSNAIGLASNNTVTMPEDFAGRRRPASGAWDAGAFHRYAAPTPGTGAGNRMLSGVGI